MRDLLPVLEQVDRAGGDLGQAKKPIFKCSTELQRLVAEGCPAPGRADAIKSRVSPHGH